MNAYPKITNAYCVGCCQRFDHTLADAYARTPNYCPTCWQPAIDKVNAEAVKKVTDELDKLTPPRFLATATDHPGFNRKLWDRLTRHRLTEEKPWLGMVGATGKSKTRCGYLYLRKLVLDGINPTEDPERNPRIPSFAALTSYEFASEVANQWNKTGFRDLHDDERTQSRRFLDKLRWADYLMIDDLGKCKATPSVTAELWALLDERHANNRWTIWTSNVMPEAIVAGMPEDIAAPLCGRIRECSTILAVS